MRRAVAVVLALISGGLVVVTVGAYFLSTFCWEYCEPGDEPTVWDGLKFALPFGIAALGLMTVAAMQFMRGGGSWMRALLVAIGSCVAGALLFWGFVWLYDALDSEAAGWVIGLAVVVVWVETTGLVARRVADRS